MQLDEQFIVVIISLLNESFKNIDKAISKNNLLNIYGTMPIMEAFKLPNIGTLFCYAKNVNQIFRNGNCKVFLESPKMKKAGLAYFFR